jgi:hypothetical protein
MDTQNRIVLRKSCARRISVAVLAEQDNFVLRFAFSTEVVLLNIDPDAWTLLLDGRQVLLMKNAEGRVFAVLSIKKSEHRFELIQK